MQYNLTKQSAMGEQGLKLFVSLSLSLFVSLLQTITLSFILW